MKIAIIVGSIREGRLGTQVGQWVKEQADTRGGSDTFDLVELADFDLPLLTAPTVPGAAKRDYDTPQTREWSQAIDSYDGFVFVTPEYNHGVPGAFKNAFDVLYPEWNHKAVGFVSYGADGGVRAVEQWRQIVANVMMVDVRGQVSLNTFNEVEDGKLKVLDRREGELKTLLDQLTSMCGVVAGLRH